MMKNIFFIIIFLSLSQLAFSQEIFQAGRSISEIDSIYLTRLPKLTLPDNYKGPNAIILPSEVNNAVLPFFRPVFTQGSWECGQAAGIAYNYTYEINRIRNANGYLEENQYPTFFTLNYFNGGETQVGVNYFYSFNMLKYTGSPNVVDYGGLTGSIKKWMSGYNKYYNAMHGLVNEVYAIDVSNEEGILTLKHWLNDHLNQSEYGGLANFYADNTEPSEVFAPGTPEEGKYIVTGFGYGNGHAMTIVGYNDSIRYDFNDDGQYTNHLDINGDDNVDIRDWEIGGFIYVNSFGTSWGNDGFCYAMYKTLAEEKSNGGIWNKSIHIIDLKDNYSPLLTYKIKLNHSSRNKLKVTAGIALDTNAILPEYTIDFPILNYQGGNYYMQGDNAIEEQREIEFGLDVTRLLSYIQPGQSARFFLKVHENDPQNSSCGSIEYFSLIDYSWGGTVTINQETPKTLHENSSTHLYVNYVPNFDKVIIETEELDAYETGQNYSHQLDASGGTPPYHWELSKSYLESEVNEPYPDIQGEQINFFSNIIGYSDRSIDFSFPFYGSEFNTLRIFVNGFIQLEPAVYPFPYQVNDQYIFENQKMLAVLFNNEFQIKPELGNGVWFEGNAEEAKIRWKVSYEVGSNDLQFDFSASILEGGKIRYFYNDIESLQNLKRVIGISNGDGINFQNSGLSQLYPNKNGREVYYLPSDFTTQMSITENGLLSLDSPKPNRIYQIHARVADEFEIANDKKFRLSDGIIYDMFIQSGNDDQIDYGETVSISLNVKNISNNDFANMEASIQTNDPYVDLISETYIMGSLAAGQSMMMNNILSVKVSSAVPNDYMFPLQFSFQSNGQTWEGISYLTAYAPELLLERPIILDNENGKADPGETFNLALKLTNMGSTGVEDLNGTYFENDPYITINSELETSWEYIGKHQSDLDTINITLAEDTPIGHFCEFALNLNNTDNYQKTLYFSFVVGRIPILIIDMDDNEVSGPVLYDLLDNFNYEFSYSKYIPENIDDFKIAFVLLGRKYVQHELTQDEGQSLADYLSNGGYLYMEGGETWHFDSQTAVHPLFNVTTEELSWHYNDTIVGIPGTFTESMKFDYIGPMPYYGYYLIPGDSAFSILKNNSNPHPMAVAYQNDQYRTLASAIDFGGLESGDSPSTKEELLLAILDFFGLETNTGIHDYNDPANNVKLSCFPNPFESFTTISLLVDYQQTVEISVYNIYGEKIYQVLNETILQAGEYNFRWNGQSDNGNKLSKGLYFCNIKAGDYKTTLKLIQMN